MTKNTFLNKENPLFCDAIRYPLSTEKTLNGQTNNTHAFLVRADATKSLIKNAVEQIFSVKVKAVNTVNVAGKKKVFRGRLGQRSDTKKAYVTLE